MMFFTILFRAVQLIALVAWYWLPHLVRRLVPLMKPGPSAAVLLRRSIERLGVSFMKLGQFLAMRFDVLPPEMCRELDQLFERTAPLPLARVRREIERELGQPIEALFSELSEKPLGAASIAQVHRATTLDGRSVAIKVQRPGIERRFAADMWLLRQVATVLDALGLGGRFKIAELVQEFAQFTAREMNFLAEGLTATTVRQKARPGGAHIPVVYPELTTSRILTMDFIEGISLLAVCQRAEAEGPSAVARVLPGVDLVDTVGRLARSILDQIFVIGLFHGDPHPGNILVRKDGVPVLIDFGIFGRLDTYTRTMLGRFYAALSVGNIDEAYRCYIRISTMTEGTAVASFREQFIDSLQRFYDATRSTTASMQERHPLRYIMEIFNILRSNAVRMPTDQLLFWRALSIISSLAVRVPVHFDLIDALRRFFIEEQRGQLTKRVIDGLVESHFVGESCLLGVQGPRLLGASLERIDDAGPCISAEPKASDGLRKDLRRWSTGLALAFVGVSLAVSLDGLAPAYAGALGVAALLGSALAWGRS